MTEYKPRAGEQIQTTAEVMCEMARGGATVKASFNGILLTAAQESSPAEIVRYYNDESDRRHKAYLASPEYAQRQADMQRRDKERLGGGVMNYAERWARIMEERISKGETVAECAGSTSHIADVDGITGFMYGCAVSILAEAWVYGEELRRWHNLKTQLHDEGERANETGGVLNPALLSLRG